MRRLTQRRIGRTIALTVECSGDNFIHLCNNSIQKESDKMGEMIDGNMWDLAEFRRHLCREYRPLRVPATLRYGGRC